MAEYTQQELLKMQQEAMRRVNEMNEWARSSLDKTPAPGRGRPAAPQFERAPAPPSAPPEKSGQGTEPPRAGTSRMGNGGNTSRPQAGMHSQRRQPRPGQPPGTPATGSGHPSGGHPVQKAAPAPPAAASSHAAPSQAAPPSGIARFLNLRQIFKDADTPLLLAVLLLLYTENDDPLLMMALVYIML